MIRSSVLTNIVYSHLLRRKPDFFSTAAGTVQLQIRFRGMTPSTTGSSGNLHSPQLSMCQLNQSHPNLQYLEGQSTVLGFNCLEISEKIWVLRHDTPFCTLRAFPSLQKQQSLVWVKPQSFKSYPTPDLSFAMEEQRQTSIWSDGNDRQICISSPCWLVVQSVYKTVGQRVLL